MTRRLKLLAILAVAIVSSARAGASELSIAELGARAIAGDRQAMVALGQSYRKSGAAGAATDWFCAAADLDDPDGLYWCGRSYWMGYGRAKDETTARARLARAVDGGNARAALLLGRISEADAAEAWFARAAQLGAPEGDYRLGLMLERRAQRTMALDAFARAASRDYTPALNALGLAFLNLPDRDADAVGQAKAHLRRAAELGDQSARLNMGDLLLHEDRGAAFRFLTLAMAGADPRIGRAAEQRRASLDKALGAATVARLLLELAPEIEATRNEAQRRTDVPD